MPSGRLGLPSALVLCFFLGLAVAKLVKLEQKGAVKQISYKQLKQIQFAISLLSYELLTG